MAPFRRGEVWWYEFYFTGRLIRKSSKSTLKTVAREAEQQRRRELEADYHDLKEQRRQRFCRLQDLVEEYLVGYRLSYRSVLFVEYALGHVCRLLGKVLQLTSRRAASSVTSHAYCGVPHLGPGEASAPNDSYRRPHEEERGEEAGLLTVLAQVHRAFQEGVHRCLGRV